MKQKTTYASLCFDILFILLSIGVFYTLFLGMRALSVPDEARYVEIPREMLTSGDFIIPHINGIKYFEKPPLFYWMQTLSLSLFGMNEWAFRLMNMLMGLTGIIATYLSTRALYSRGAALTTAFVLATSLFYYAMSHFVTLDMTVSTFITISLLCFIISTETNSPIKRRLLMYGAFSAAALAVLTKGLIGIVFPIMIVGLWVIVLNEWRVIRRSFLPTSILLFLVITVPWHVLAQLRAPEFLHFYFVTQQFTRYATLYAHHYQPVWFFVPVLIFGFTPWFVFLIQAIKAYFPTQWKQRFAYRKEIFLLLWAISIFIFFSFSDSKLIPYMAPVFPPLAILIGRYIYEGLKDKTIRPGLRWGFYALPFFAILLGAGLLTAAQFEFFPHQTTAKILLGTMTIVFFIGTLQASLTYKRHLQSKQTDTPFILVVLTSMITYLLFVLTVPYFDTSPIKPLAQQLKPILKQDDVVVSYFGYYQDLPVYLEQKVTVVEWHGELLFGLKHQHPHPHFIQTAAFWPQWNSEMTMYMLIDKDRFQKVKQQFPHSTFHIIGETQKTFLIANKEGQ